MVVASWVLDKKASKNLLDEFKNVEAVDQPSERAQIEGIPQRWSHQEKE